ncbi:MAG TPA: leucine--tRNA ligase [Erysipelotrichaceae bacterium]|nr:leucine--tRNA ligase [Erysipelotrichaceae bacterium]
MGFNHRKIEKKWQKYWAVNKTFKTDVYDFSKPKYYVLDMFPYPSGSGLHAGHPEGYTATDIVSRMKRMQGYNVLHPMGYDSFGLPAEQYAIETGNHPEIFTKKNIVYFTNQLKELGFDYDWDRVISTSDSEYYRWTQWIFKGLFLDGYAKYIDMPVNWCEELGTVLSNDEIIDGKSERGGYPVVRKNLKQWVIDQTKFAEQLLEGLDRLDWPESTKEMQRNWIGKSTGAEITFKVANSEHSFDVFTTRADTIFGCTYCVLSPEHPLVNIIVTAEQKAAIESYQKEAATKSEIERTSTAKDKTGCFTGAYAINPLSHKLVPIFISDYILSTYGTGAIMAVPAHDSRDYAFAKKYQLDIIPVLEGGNIEEEAFEGDGLHINSDFINGLNQEEANTKMLGFLEKNHMGQKKVNYKFREWIFARQRYWGEPVPIVHLEDGGIHVLDDDELPLILPELDDYKGRDGKAPLENAKEWVKYHHKGVKGNRETSTMPGSAGSSWYFLRYVDPHNKKIFCDKKLADHWLPVDLYIGGPEHAVGHLIYSRIWTKYLNEKGYISFDEPFKKLIHQGMILGSNNIKMGKRYPEFVVNPSDIIKEYGADAFRLYEMFMGPLEANKPWSDQGVEAAHKFLERVYRIIIENNVVIDEPTLELELTYHQTVKKVTEDYENLCFNTAISQMMIFINEVYRVNKINRHYAEGFVKLLSPICPHLAEEMWQKLGHETTIAFASWPKYQEDKLVLKTVKMGVTVNGKLRGEICVNVDEEEETIKKMALEVESVKRHLADKKIVKIIVVKNRIVNVVVK